MKKRIFAAVMALCLLAGTGAFAQEKKMMPKERPTAEQMAQRKADRMKEKLSLNDMQTKQIYDMNLEQIKQMQMHHEKMKADRMAEATKMKGILTPDQYKQWEEMQGQMRAHKGGKDGKMGMQGCCKDAKKCDKPASEKKMK